MKAELVLVHAPYGRDAAIICQVLERSQIAASACRTVEELCSQLGEDTGAALISDESLTAANVALIAGVVSKQPPWSDLPMIVTTSGGEATEGSRRLLPIVEPLGNVSLVERPLRTVTLVSVVRSALRGRRRQYQLRENYAERERLVHELKRSNDELAQFAHIVSHDLQAPIRMVMSFSQLLGRRFKGQLDEEADSWIGAIQGGATTMEALVRSLLSYATVGQEAMTQREVALASLVDGVVATLQPLIEECHATVSHGELPTIRGDQVQLRQLMQNLIGNALKYCEPATEPIVTISARRAGLDWLVRVQDNGPGIPPEHHDRIFLPLKRLHGHEISGTGMGLAVCRKIVERHGGRIWVESEPGQGAAFCFTLAAIAAKTLRVADSLSA